MSSSSSCKRAPNFGKLVNLPKTKGPHPIGFICADLNSNFQHGVLKRVSKFADEYGVKVPTRVYLLLPNGATWFGTYVHGNGGIEGLENFMSYYDVKPYNMVSFEYSADSTFSIELYNCYSVEIDYGLVDIPLDLGKVSHNHLGVDVRKLLDPNDCEIDKFCSTMNYNGTTTCSVAYELFITGNHLRKHKFCEVLSMNNCSELGLDETVDWIDLCFTRFKWRINLKWDIGHVYFGEEWFRFIEDSRLKVGDLCLLRYTSSRQKFEVAIFDKFGMDNINRNGLEGKGLLKFVKIMNYETVLTGEMEIPRLFDREFGWTLSENIRILLADGYEYEGYYCEGSKLLIGMKGMLLKYKVEENYVLSFDLVGRSIFYVKIYNTAGMEIFNNMYDKLILSTVLSSVEDDVIVLSDSSMERGNKFSGGSESTEFEYMGTTDSDSEFSESSILEVSLDGNLNEIISFNRVLTKVNVHKDGHGVYLCRELLPIYQTWEKTQIVTILCAGRTWNVGIYRFKKQCRFGRGWKEFVLDNRFTVGVSLKFCHGGGSRFDVSISDEI